MTQRFLLTFLFLFFTLHLLNAQGKVINPKPKASPICIANFVGENTTYLKVTYGQPSKKGREIFGTLVPYKEIWRTGANEATELTTTVDLKINKKTLKAGTYTLFTIPDADKWTIIFNSVLGQWGAYKYEEIKDKNVISFEVPVSKSEDMYEVFTIVLEENKKGADMLLLWDTTRIVIPFTFINAGK